GEESVAAFGGAILHDVFPLLSVVVFLGFGPGVAGGEVESVRIGGPGESVDFFLTLGYRNGFAAGWRDQVDLGGFSFVVFVFVFFLVFSFFVGGIGIFSGSGLALGEERDPVSIGRPFGLGVVAGLRKLYLR